MSKDPLAVIATATPGFSEEAAIAVMRDRYGLSVRVTPLVSERDQNFRIIDDRGRQFVLKIANAAEDPEVTRFQIEALLHIEKYVRERDVPVCAPSIVRTIDGNTEVTMESPEGRHVARVVTYLDGVPLSEAVPSARLSRNMGISFARLGQALADFSHPGSGQVLLWDMQQVLQIRPLLKHIPKPEVERAVTAALDEFERHAWPAFTSLRSQVIHNDLNPDNVLIDAEQREQVAGVIDFGDMLHAPLIVDVAIAASYHRPKSGNPLQLIAEFLTGYHSITPLTIAETDILFELIQARLCATVAILYWRASARDASDPYLAGLLNAESFAETFLARLREIPRDSARQVFRQTCASVALA